MKLHNYWRSGSSHRTRIALALKGLEYDYVAVDLRTGAHKSQSFLTMNPQGLVPTLALDDGTLIAQSPAILEYLEDRFPHPSLLSDSPEKNAEIRRRAAIIGCDTHPLNNLRLLNYLKQELNQDQQAVNKWITHWIETAFSALEEIISTDIPAPKFCFGETPSMADCYLIPQIYSAERFGVDLKPYPTLRAIDAHCHTMVAFQQAHPNRQPDAD